MWATKWIFIFKTADLAIILLWSHLRNTFYPNNYIAYKQKNSYKTNLSIFLLVTIEKSFIFFLNRNQKQNRNKLTNKHKTRNQFFCYSVYYLIYSNAAPNHFEGLIMWKMMFERQIIKGYYFQINIFLNFKTDLDEFCYVYS